MRQLITGQLGITMPCLLRVIDANQPGRDTLAPKMLKCAYVFWVRVCVCVRVCMCVCLCVCVWVGG